MHIKYIGHIEQTLIIINEKIQRPFRVGGTRAAWSGSGAPGLPRSPSRRLGCERAREEPWEMRWKTLSETAEPRDGSVPDSRKPPSVTDPSALFTKRQTSMCGRKYTCSFSPF